MPDSYLGGDGGAVLRDPRGSDTEFARGGGELLPPLGPPERCVQAPHPPPTARIRLVLRESGLGTQAQVVLTREEEGRVG